MEIVPSISVLRRKTTPAVSAYSASCSKKTKTLLVLSATVPSLGKTELDSFRTLSAKSSSAFAPYIIELNTIKFR